MSKTIKETVKNIVKNASDFFVKPDEAIQQQAQDKEESLSVQFKVTPENRLTICDYIQATVDDCENSRSEFMDKRKEGIKLYEGTRENKSKPWAGCFSRDTDILTKRGWINIVELTMEDFVYSMNPYTHEAYYMPVIRLVRTYYEQMILFKGKSIDLMVSPDHNMLIEGRDKKHFYNRFELAEKLHKNQTTIKGIPLVSNFKHYKETDKLYSFTASDWMIFLGWYISEGFTYKSGTVAICQSRTANLNKCNEIEDLLNRMNLRWTYSSNKQYLISCKSLSKEAREHLKSIGDVYHKHIPREYLELSPTLLHFLFESLMKGDGCTRERGGKYPVRSYYTVSKQLADDFQELLQKIGLRGRISSREGKRHLFKERIVKGQTGYAISVNGKERIQVKKLFSEFVSYNDFAYCLETPFHTVYVRRNGIAVWSGNCSNISTMVTTVSCDLLHAKLFPMVWNPDSLHWEGREKHDAGIAENIKNLMTFVVGSAEMKLEPTIDDILQTLIVDGTICIKKSWRPYWTYVTRLVPKITAQAVISNKLEYEVQYDYVKRERCFVEIVPLERVFLPYDATSDQDCDYIIQEIWYTMAQLREMKEDGIISPDVELNDLLKAMDELPEFKGTEQQKMQSEGTSPLNTRKEMYKIKCYEGFIKYDVNADNRREECVFLMAAKPKMYLSGKPLHVVSRIGKRPWLIRPFLRRPGRIYGKSIPELTMNLHKEVDAIHNQRIDAGNMAIAPFFFYRAGSGQVPSNISVGPATGVPLDEPDRDIRFPTFPSWGLQYSFQEERIVLEMIERLTYLTPAMMGKETASRPTVRGTLAVMSQGEQKFSLLARRVQYIICDLISDIKQTYEENLPPELQERIQGNKDNIWRFLSPETIAGQYDAKMVLDLSAGNIAQEREINAIVFQTMGMDPYVQQNPAYGWEIRADYLRSMNKPVEKIIGPKPQTLMDPEDINDEFERIKQGQNVKPLKGQDHVKHLNGHLEQRRLRGNELSPESNVLLNMHIMDTKLMYAETMQERMAQYVQAGYGQGEGLQ